MAFRLSNQPAKLVTVFGGSGFVGRHVVKALARRGYRIRVAVRRPDLAGFLLADGAVGQIALVQANVRYPDSVARAVAGADAVVNLVGILNQTGRQTFSSVQAAGAGTIAGASAAAGIKSFVHVSAIGAEPEAASLYARSKAAGEAAVSEAIPSAVIVRPSLVFGIDDSFFNRLAAMLAAAPVMPLFTDGNNLFQPVYVGDVAEAIARLIDGAGRPGTVYEFGGPEVESFRDLALRVGAEIRRKPRFVRLPAFLARAIAAAAGLMPNPPITRDQLELLGTNNLVSPEAIAGGRTLAALGVAPTAMAAILPTYLYRFLPHGQYDITKPA